MAQQEILVLLERYHKKEFSSKEIAGKIKINVPGAIRALSKLFDQGLIRQRKEKHPNYRNVIVIKWSY